MRSPGPLALVDITDAAQVVLSCPSHCGDQVRTSAETWHRGICLLPRTELPCRHLPQWVRPGRSAHVGPAQSALVSLDPNSQRHRLRSPLRLGTRARVGWVLRSSSVAATPCAWSTPSPLSRLADPISRNRPSLFPSLDSLSQTSMGHLENCFPIQRGLESQTRMAKWL